jgi:acyl-CoA synthetase (AMP-forming)/AMP-acid ligase II
MHPDGYIELRDRAKDIIISGGENVSSIEVERVLLRHLDVVEAVVVGQPDQKWGERPRAYVTLRPGAELDEEAFVAFARRHLRGFEAPDAVEFGELGRVRPARSARTSCASAPSRSRPTDDRPFAEFAPRGGFLEGPIASVRGSP